jgi:hypothetical protein
VELGLQLPEFDRQEPTARISEDSRRFQKFNAIAWRKTRVPIAASLIRSAILHTAFDTSLYDIDIEILTNPAFIPSIERLCP